MGCSNATCTLTNLPIESGMPAYLIPLAHYRIKETEVCTSPGSGRYSCIYYAALGKYDDDALSVLPSEETTPLDKEIFSKIYGTSWDFGFMRNVTDLRLPNALGCLDPEDREKKCAPGASFAFVRKDVVERIADFKIGVWHHTKNSARNLSFNDSLELIIQRKVSLAVKNALAVKGISSLSTRLLLKNGLKKIHPLILSRTTNGRDYGEDLLFDLIDRPDALFEFAIKSTLAVYIDYFLWRVRKVWAPPVFQQSNSYGDISKILDITQQLAKAAYKQQGNN
jgi:hypothetical protein